MVDFRYHLISLIAVILALALGILAGSGFLGGPILEQLRNEVDDLATTADSLRDEVNAQEARLNHAETFARSVQPLLVEDSLAGTDIVVFQLAGSSGGLVDGVKRALLDAGGTIATEITFTSKLTLSSNPAVDELTLITGSLAAEKAELVEETALLIGQRMAAAADDPGPPQSPTTSATQRLLRLLDDLERAEFIGVSTQDEARIAPQDATFVVIGGATDRPPFDVSLFGPALAEGLTGRGGRALIAESSDSIWGLVRSIRADIEARSVATTVDNAETTVGRISAVLGLDRAAEGIIGHFGIQPGSTALIPDPAQSG